MSGTVARAVVFDLDGTLIAGDSFGQFLIRWLRHRPHRFLLALLLLPVAVFATLLRPWRRAMASHFLWFGTLGVRDRVFERALNEAAERHPVFRQGGEVLKRHLEGGNIVVVATGCARILAERILQNFPGVTIVGSQLERRWGGLVCTEHCYGENKIHMLAKAGHSPPFARVYTDSLADLPLVKAASEATLVNPSARGRVRYGALGIEGVETWS